MAAVHKKIDLAIRLMALVMLVLGILMIVAPFRIKHHSQELTSSNYYWFYDNTLYLYCAIRLSKIWQMYWAGIMGVLCTIYVFLSMVSALVLITQEANNMGRIRDYDTDKCIIDKYYENNNMYHYSGLITWFYILIIPSNIVVGLCVIQHIAFFVKWTLEVTSNIENSTIEHNPGQEYPRQSSRLQASSSRNQASPSYLTQPLPHNSTNDMIGMKDLNRYHGQQQPTHQQRPSQDCDYRCPYHTPQPPHCHQCHHARYAKGHPHSNAAPQEAESCVPTAKNGQNPEMEK